MFSVKNMKKYIFINKHGWLDLLEDRKIFVTKLVEFKPYLVMFDENNTIKNKIYLSDYVKIINK